MGFWRQIAQAEGALGMKRRLDTIQLIAVFAAGFFCAVAQYATAVTVTSLADLRNASATMNNSTITLAPGDYWIDGDHIANPTSSEPIFLELGGNNNTFVLTGANLKLDTRKLDGFGRALGHDSGVRVVKVSGSNNIVQDLDLTGYDLELDTDPDAQRYADWAAVYVQLTGTDNTMQGVNVLTRGSSPYGLGDAFGKGARQFPQGEPPGQVPGEPEGVVGHPWIHHNKTSAFNVLEANGATVDDMHLDVRTYGHGFFVQLSDDTTLTNSTVTGQIFSSTNVSTHPKYLEYGGITKDGNPIPDDIFISGAEDGVRMYTGASNLSVDNVVVTKMRSGFAVALGSGNITLNNVESYGAEHAFDFRSNTTITNAKGDIVNGPLIWHPYGNSANSSIDVELVGPAPVGHDWAAAFISGNNVDATISSNLPAGALGDDALVRFGQRWWNSWRDHDDLDSFDEQAFDYINSSFTNNTNQIMVLGNDVTNNTGSSQAPVISNGKENYYDGITLVPAGTRTVLIHSAGLGNNGTAADGSLETNASIVESGGTLELQPGIQISDEKLTITGEGVDGKGALYSDGQTGSGTRFGSSDSQNESTIFLAGDASIGVGVAGNQMLVGSIQGTGNLTKRGPGKLAIEQASTYVGNMFIAEGEVSARSGVVKDDLFLFPGTTFTSIGDNALDAADSFAQVNGTLDLNGRTDNSHLSATAGLLYGAGQILSSNPTSGAGATLNVAGDAGQGTFVGTIEDEISLIKSGASTQLLAGNNTYTGTTTISEGTLQVNGTHTGGGDYTVAGGTLAGTGSIDASVTVQAGGTLAPGASPGQLTVGDVVFETSSVLEIELGGLTAGSEYDQLLADSIILAGDLSVSLLDLGSGLFQPAPTDIFTVIDGISLSGVFDNVAIGQRIDTTGGEGSFMVSYVAPIGAVLLTDYQVSTMPGDFNGDGWVDALDFLHWQRDPAAGDLADWQDNYGATNTHTANAVPEPGALSSIIIATAMFITRRPRKSNS